MEERNIGGRKMKYKVGDKLKVREDFIGPTREFSRYQGEIVTVKCVGQEIDRQWYRIEEDGGRHHWPEIAFEQLPPKALIQTGSIVECKNGKKYIFLNGRFMNENGETFMSIDWMNESDDSLTTARLQPIHEIEKIYASSALVLNELFEQDCLSVIWERKKEREMTFEEIEKALGHPVKIVKGE